MTIIPRLFATLAACFCVSGYGDPLTISTWGGSHARVVSTEILGPFSAYFDVQIDHDTDDQYSHESRKIPGIVELSLFDAIDACEKSEILLLPLDSMPGTTADQSLIRDFMPNSLQPCAIGHSVWATVVAFDNNRYGNDEKPHLISDFFNTNFYPGKRIIRRSPRVLIEWALVASGIRPTQVYDALDNSEHSWALIEQKLKLIENEVIWVDSDAEALSHLRSGYAAFAMLGSDSLVRDSIEQSGDLGVLWDAAVTELGLWAIPTEAPNPALSWEFIQYASNANNSGKVASFFGYGPVRHSTLKLMDRGHQKMLPSWRANQRNLLWGNARWWRDHSEDIVDRFAQWVMDIEDRPVFTLATVSDDISISGLLPIDSRPTGRDQFYLSWPSSIGVIGKLAQ